MKTKKNEVELRKQILKAEKMTPERLKIFPEFEEIEAVKAKDVIETLECFCSIIITHLSE